MKSKEFICYMDAQDYRDMQKGTIKWCAVGTEQSKNDTDVKLFASLPAKEITNQEIKELYLSMKALDQSNILIRFSRELLRKANEK